MKRVLAVCAVAVLCLSAIAVAAPDDNPKTDTTLSGTISRVDMAGKSMVVKDSAGKETTVYWTDSTTVDGGELREGTPVKLSVTDKDGKTWANSIQVAKKPSY
jgi:photosystem II stability/assembly factor-like uncharacterized protein